jgi:hypothetical protein
MLASAVGDSVGAGQSQRYGAIGSCVPNMGSSTSGRSRLRIARTPRASAAAASGILCYRS